MRLRFAGTSGFSFAMRSPPGWRAGWRSCRRAVRIFQALQALQALQVMRLRLSRSSHLRSGRRQRFVALRRDRSARGMAMASETALIWSRSLIRLMTADDCRGADPRRPRC